MELRRRLFRFTIFSLLLSSVRCVPTMRLEIKIAFNQITHRRESDWLCSWPSTISHYYTLKFTLMGQEFLQERKILERKNFIILRQND